MREGVERRNLLLPTEGDRKDVCGKIYFRLYVVQIWELGSSETQDFLRPPSVIPFAIPNFIYGKWGSTRKIPWCPFLRSLVGQEIYETGSSSSSSSSSPKGKKDGGILIWRDGIFPCPFSTYVDFLPAEMEADFIFIPPAPKWGKSHVVY